MAKLSLSRAWDETKAVLGRDGRLIGVVALAMFFLPGVVAGVVAPKGGSELPGSTNEALLMTVVAVIGLIGQLSIIRLALGERSTVGEAIGYGARRAPSYLAATILWIAPFAIGFYLFGVEALRAPADVGGMDLLAMLLLLCLLVFISVRMMMTSSVASAERAGPIDILRRSWQLTRGHWWKLFAFFILFLIVVLIVMAAVGAAAGILAALLFRDIEPMSVGALLVAVLTQLATAILTTGFLVMLARIYTQLSGPAHADVSVPSSGT